MDFVGGFPEGDRLRAAIEHAYRSDESECLDALLDAADPGEAVRRRIGERAGALVETIRSVETGGGGLDAFLQEYELSNQEGVTLMCLAEALLRIPDAATADKLIREKIAGADWARHIGQSDSAFVNASTWALMLTGRVVSLDQGETADVGGFLGKLVAKSGEPVIRAAMIHAMKIMGRQFVMGRTIDEALRRSSGDVAAGYRHSYDMLGEGARTEADARAYFDAYAVAIAAVGREAAGRGPVESPGVSVKLSALHPRFETAQAERVLDQLVPRLHELARIARDAGISLCIDAEEADRLELSLDVIEAVAGDSGLAGWDGFGLAVQAYQKRALPVLDWLAELGERHRRRFMVRLVKGAYWDTEIKRSQEQGLTSYPVFTRKASTDVSYLACARHMLARRERFYSQFATHNAHTVAAVIEIAGDGRDFEFQRLHGMGESLYAEVVDPYACRVYAPVGSHEDLLAYLVRRLLENGANTSFVNRIVDESAPVAEIVADPITAVRRLEQRPHPRIPLPRDLFDDGRLNSLGVDLSDTAALRRLAEEMAAADRMWTASPGDGDGSSQAVFEAADRSLQVGTVRSATTADIETAVATAEAAARAWDATPADERAAILERAADGLEDAMPEFMALAVREAGKTIDDAVSEVREAVDFLRYYAARARIDFAQPTVMPGPTGETNTVRLHGRGVFLCISPWNFPLAIFLGQVSAALAAGNAVIAKPAEQTPLIAARAVDLLYQAGLPRAVLHLLPGDGPTVGAPLVADPRIAGVAFTGSTDTARAINRSLAARDGAIAPLIAETGGQNAMIVDSTALPEQVIDDAVFSAFRSAGQRCSALRVLFVQDDIAERVIGLLQGATEELAVGNPRLLKTDIGPVIDEAALDRLCAHTRRMDREATLLCRARLGPDTERGAFFAPCAYEIDSLDRLDGEVFGPVLHVVRYAADRLNAVLDSINASGFGLTLGVHSRVVATQRKVHESLRVGNTYVNRNMIGAVVGVQPFGGQGLSGTGPKAGGPHYLHRFAVERTLTINTAAAGGNADLMSLEA